MAGTFINQHQFDDIDICMAYMERARVEIDNFTRAAEIYSFTGTASPPSTQIGIGESQARLWKLKSDPGHYRFLSAHIDELAIFSQHLNSHVSGLAPAEKKRPVLSLRQLSPPPGPVPAYATSPITNCFERLHYHQEWVWALAEILRAANPGHEAIREAIYKTLPRIFDFMAMHLQTANTKRPRPARLSTAQQYEKGARYHYVSGMGAIANFLAQYQRITALFSQATQRFSQLDEFKTVAELNTHTKLMMVELRQAQRFSKEIVELRTRQ